GAAAIGVPAEDLAGEAQATHRVRAGGQRHAARWHLEDVRGACCVEHVRPLEEARESLAVLAVADEAEAGRRGNVARDALHTAAPAAKREILRGRTHGTRLVDPPFLVLLRDSETGKPAQLRWLSVIPKALPPIWLPGGEPA